MRWSLAGICLLLLLAPGAWAASGDVTATSASYRGGAEKAGELAALFITDGEVPTDLSNPRLTLTMQAAKARILEIETNTLVPPDVMGIQQGLPDPRHPNEPAREVLLEHGHVEMTEAQDSFQVHALAVDTVRGIPFDATSDAGAFAQYESLYMHAGSFRQAQAGDDDVRADDSAAFWEVRLDQPVVVHEDLGGHYNMVLHGDFVLEVRGATFEARDGSGTNRLESGIWRETLATVPGPLGAGLTAQREVLLRMFVEDARLHLSVHGGTPQILWAGTQVTSDHPAGASLEGASGRIMDDGRLVVLQDERYQLPVDSSLRLTPGPQAMSVGVQPIAAPGSAAPLAFAAAAPSVAVGLAAGLSLAVAVGLGIAWRRAQRLGLRDVEAALEAQQFRLAARFARRILRRSPGQEDAVLGRAIALAKSGRNARAVFELRRHLQSNAASDGSLHYVLGLSLLDEGRRAEARQALEEAVRRTPALQADVASRLGSVGSAAPLAAPQPSSIRLAHPGEANGYA